MTKTTRKGRRKTHKSTRYHLLKGKKYGISFSGSICAQTPKARGETGEKAGLVGCGTSRWCERT